MLAVILAGGFGTRLQSVLKDCPKPLAPILDDVTFLDIQIDYLISEGVREIVILTHHLHEQFVKHFAVKKFSVPIRILREEFPMGTGGALLNAAKVLRLKGKLLLLNGDTFLRFSVSQFVEHGQSHLVSILASYKEDASRYGTLAVEKKGKLIRFQEKEVSGAGLVNSGVYLIDIDQLMLLFPDVESCSLEKDLIPRALQQNKEIYVQNTNEPFIDIGTPESYFYFKQMYSELEGKRGS